MNTRSREQSLRQSIDNWTLTVSRLMGLAGLGYELVLDHLQNPTALVVFGGLAGLREIWEIHKSTQPGDPP